MTEMSANMIGLFRLRIRVATSKRLIWFFLLSGILVASVAVTPFHEGEFTVCILKNVLGIPCPGCGMTRAFLFIGHGDIHAALRLNINSLLAFFIIAILWLHAGFNIITGKEVKVHLTRREMFLIYLSASAFMISGWIYNILINPWV